MRDEELVLVNAQVSAVAGLPKPSFSAAALGGAGSDGAVKDRRPMYVGGAWTTATIYERARLAPGATIAGPAIVEQADSTTMLGPGDRGRIDAYRNLIVTVDRETGR
jgi:N-methylhydantoinase A